MDTVKSSNLINSIPEDDIAEADDVPTDISAISALKPKNSKPHHRRCEYILILPRFPEDEQELNFHGLDPFQAMFRRGSVSSDISDSEDDDSSEGDEEEEELNIQNEDIDYILATLEFFPGDRMKTLPDRLQRRASRDPSLAFDIPGGPYPADMKATWNQTMLLKHSQDVLKALRETREEETVQEPNSEELHNGLKEESDSEEDGGESYAWRHHSKPTSKPEPETLDKPKSQGPIKLSDFFGLFNAGKKEEEGERKENKEEMEVGKDRNGEHATPQSDRDGISEKADSDSHITEPSGQSEGLSETNGDIANGCDDGSDISDMSDFEDDPGSTKKPPQKVEIFDEPEIVSEHPTQKLLSASSDNESEPRSKNEIENETENTAENECENTAENEAENTFGTETANTTEMETEKTPEKEDESETKSDGKNVDSAENEHLKDSQTLLDVTTSNLDTKNSTPQSLSATNTSPKTFSKGFWKRANISPKHNSFLDFFSSHDSSQKQAAKSGSKSSPNTSPKFKNRRIRLSPDMRVKMSSFSPPPTELDTTKIPQTYPPPSDMKLYRKSKLPTTRSRSKSPSHLPIPSAQKHKLGVSTSESSKSSQKLQTPRNATTSVADVKSSASEEEDKLLMQKRTSGLDMSIPTGVTDLTIRSSPESFRKSARNNTKHRTRLSLSQSGKSHKSQENSVYNRIKLSQEELNELRDYHGTPGSDGLQRVGTDYSSVTSEGSMSRSRMSSSSVRPGLPDFSRAPRIDGGRSHSEAFNPNARSDSDEFLQPHKTHSSIDVTSFPKNPPEVKIDITPTQRKLAFRKVEIKTFCEKRRNLGLVWKNTHRKLKEKKWKQRRFELHKGRLAYYKKHVFGGEVNKSKIWLKDATVVPVKTSIEKHKFCVQLTNDNGVFLMISVKDDGEQGIWEAALNSHILYCGFF